MHKFNAKATTLDKIKFPSKLEARYYAHLKILEKAGEVVGFFMQVPMHLSCGAIYKMDFLVFYSDGSCAGIDVKGIETDVFKLKHKMIKQEFPWFDLQIVKKF